jgi:hypothetical protein
MNFPATSTAPSSPSEPRRASLALAEASGPTHQQANSGFHWRIWAAAAPAVTLAFRMIGKVSRHDVVGYLVAQFAGSLIE